MSSKYYKPGSCLGVAFKSTEEKEECQMIIKNLKAKLGLPSDRIFHMALTELKNKVFNRGE